MCSVELMVKLMLGIPRACSMLRTKPQASQLRVAAPRAWIHWVGKQVLRIAQAIEEEIRSGRWAPGKPAPSRNDLAERYGVARETAAHARRWLTGRGYTVAVAGVGMVVTPPDRWPQSKP
jgi:hypothetical protein